LRRLTAAQSMLQRKRSPVGSCLWVLSQGKLLAAAFRAWRSVAWVQASTQALQQVGIRLADCCELSVPCDGAGVAYCSADVMCLRATATQGPRWCSVAWLQASTQALQQVSSGHTSGWLLRQCCGRLVVAVL
jgi:hypothetical protein